MIALRPLNLDLDAEAVARLLSLTRLEPATAPQVRDWWRARFDVVRSLQVATGADGEVLAFLEVAHDGWLKPNHFYLNVMVGVPWRGQGIGSRLYAEGAAFAQAHGATHLEAEVRDNDPAALRFAETRGFCRVAHTFESVLDLDGFDETPFLGHLTRAQAAGVRFFSLADLGTLSEDNLRRLYDLNRAAALDNPGNPGVFEPFESFRHTVFEASWFRPDGQWLAADGERWVGLAAVVLYPESHSSYNGFTGVDAAYRGRGLATALKLLAIRWARAQGARSMRTDNDSRNAAMLAINHKLGYRSRPGSYRLVRDLAAAAPEL